MHLPKNISKALTNSMKKTWFVSIFESSAIPHIKDPSFLFISTTHWSARFCMTHHGRTWKSLKINGSWPSKARQNELTQVSAKLHEAFILLHRLIYKGIEQGSSVCVEDATYKSVNLMKIPTDSGGNHVHQQVHHTSVVTASLWNSINEKKQTPRPSQHKRQNILLQIQN